MSTSDKAGDKQGEASMDEILASIRKIIADDPNSPRNGADKRATNPLLAPAMASPRSDDGAERDAWPLPPADRLAEAIRASAEQMRGNVAPPPRGIMIPRVQSVADLGLGDLIEDHPPLAAEPLRSQSGVTSTNQNAASAANAPGTWASWRNFRPGGPEAIPSASARAAPAIDPLAVAATPIPATPPIDAQLAIDPPVSPAAIEAQLSSLAVPSQPQTSKPSVGANNGLNGASAVNGHDASHAASAASKSPAPQTPPKSSAAPLVAGTDAVAKVALDVSPARPSADVSAADAKAVAAKPSSAAPLRQPASFASVFPRTSPQQFSTGPAAVVSNNPATPPVAMSAQEPENAAASGEAAEASVVTPVAEHAAPSMQVSTPTEVAASKALEKLAAGLSEPPSPLLASAPPVAVPQSMPAAVVATPSVAIATSAPVPPGDAPASAAPQTASRTLEDMVADMLRPMLEKWVEANMPRLMEKALRGDGGKGPKPPGH